MNKFFIIVVDFLLNSIHIILFLSTIIAFTVFTVYQIRKGGLKNFNKDHFLCFFLSTSAIVTGFLIYDQDISSTDKYEWIKTGEYSTDDYKLRYIKERKYINFTKKYCLEKLGFNENIDELLKLDEDSLSSVIYSLDTMLLIKNNKNLTDDEKKKLLDEILIFNDGFDKRIFYVDRMNKLNYEKEIKPKLEEIDRTEKEVNKRNYEKIFQDIGNIKINYE